MGIRELRVQAAAAAAAALIMIHSVQQCEHQVCEMLMEMWMRCSRRHLHRALPPGEALLHKQW